MCTGIVAGSLDPVTTGHTWVIEQAATLMDKLYVVIGVNPAKKYFFNMEQRKRHSSRQFLD